MPRNTSWEQIRSEAGLNETHMVALARLEEAERRLDAARRRRGVTDRAMADALGVTEDETWEVGADDDLYLFALARHVAAAGGRLELRAVFGDEEVVLLSEPEPPAPS